MSATLVDANVLLDLLTNDPTWAAWSLAQLDRASANGAILINDIVYAELSVRFTTIEDLDGFLEKASIAVAPMPRSALFLAGKAFKLYRAAGGSRTTLLPDFFIGAHAAILGAPLLTRDDRRYQTYFPTVALIAP